MTLFSGPRHTGHGQQSRHGVDAHARVKGLGRALGGGRSGGIAGGGVIVIGLVANGTIAVLLLARCQIRRHVNCLARSILESTAGDGHFGTGGLADHCSRPLRKSTAGNVRICFAHGAYITNNVGSLFSAAKSTARNRQHTLVIICATTAVIDDRYRAICNGFQLGAVKVSVCNGQFIVILHTGLRKVFKLAAVNSHHTAIVILHSIQATAECAAIDDHGRRISLASSVIIAICYHAGEAPILRNRYPSINGHRAKILNGVKRVVSAIFLRFSVLLTSGEAAAVQNCGCPLIVKQCRAGVAYIVHGAGAGNGQGTIIHDGMLASLIGQRKRTQIQSNNCAGFHGQCASSQRDITGQLIGTRIESCHFCRDWFNTICPAGGAEGQGHDQRQHGCQYLFHC